MLSRVLAAQGVAVLVLMVPPGILAQLPDAPMPSDSVRAAQSSAGDPAAVQTNLEGKWTARAAETPAEHGAGIFQF